MEICGQTDLYAKEGDLVILYETFDSLVHVRLTEDGFYDNKHGTFRHIDMIGQLFGSRVLSRKGNKFIYMLKPTPELWTLSLPHRTQILYNSDISYVLMALDVKPGHIVIESGTGSGSLSTSFARAVAPTGHVYTFEFNEVRAIAARREFDENGIGHLLTVTHQDVCEHGFGTFPDESADSVFLDLPQPWLALDAASKALKRYGHIACFSPCIEQVQETCKKLAELGFQDIRTVETLIHPYEVKPEQTLPPPLLPGMAYNGKAAATVLQQLQRASSTGMDLDDDSQTAQQTPSAPAPPAPQAGSTDASAVPVNVKPPLRVGQSADATVALASRFDGRLIRTPGSGRLCQDSASAADDAIAAESGSYSDAPLYPVTQNSQPIDSPFASLPADEAVFNLPLRQPIARAVAEIRGHTSYLTFATLYKDELEYSQSGSKEGVGVAAAKSDPVQSAP